MPIDDTEVAIASTGNTEYLDLVQTTKSGDKVQQLVKELFCYFSVQDIANKKGFSKVDCADGGSKILNGVREEFKNEFVRSNAEKLTNILKAIVPHPKKNKNKYYLSYGVRLLAFQDGSSNLEELVVDKDDCIILIPIVIIGPATGTLMEGDGATARQTTFTCEVGLELVISGRCSIKMEPKSKAVCVVLTMGKDKE